ncbi:hypothetical protein ACHWQZ_G012918 [Mnemiopsis leidyi]
MNEISEDPVFCYLNISGHIFKTRHRTLNQFPNTLLGSNEKDTYYDKERNMYCFYRDRQSFDSILYYYQSGGVLRKPPNVSEEIFNKEVVFFKIRSHLTKNGVMQSTNPKVKGLKRILSQKPTEYMHYQKLLRIQIIDLAVTILFVVAVVCEQLIQPDMRDSSPRQRLKQLSGSWKNLDTPLKIIMAVETLCTLWITTFLIMRFYWSEDRKKFAKSFMAIMDAFVVLSYFVTLILFELEAYLEEQSGGEYDQHRIYKIYRVMACLRMIKLFRMVHVFNLARYNALFFSLGMAVKSSFSDLLVIFIFIFFCVVTYATIIFWVEFDFKPQKEFNITSETFMRSLINSTIANSTGTYNMTLQNELCPDFLSINLFDITTENTSVKVLENFISRRTSTYSILLQLNDKCSLKLNLSTDVDNMSDKFDSVFSCMWWSLITITTVGYGDMVPASTVGKIIGACCACSGVPLIAIPLPIISQKFDVFYRRYCKRMERRNNRKEGERLSSKWQMYLDRPFFDTDAYMKDVIKDAGPAWAAKSTRAINV